MFDVQSFLDASTTEANSTVSTPVPEGEFTAIVDKVDARTWTSKKDPSKSGVTLDITWLIDDQSVKEALGRDKVSVRQGIMLDLNEAGSGLDMGKGKNVQLGKLRQATGLNNPGQAFAFSMLTGRMAKVVVKQRVDEDDPEKIYSEVKAVAPI